MSKKQKIDKISVEDDYYSKKLNIYHKQIYNNIQLIELLKKLLGKYTVFG